MVLRGGTLDLCKCRSPEQIFEQSCDGNFFHQEVLLGRCMSTARALAGGVHRSIVSSSISVLALTGHDEGHDVASTLSNIDMSFFFLSLFIPYRKEQLVTGARRLTIS